MHVPNHALYTWERELAEQIGERTNASVKPINPRLPTFFAAGASKSGTTSLYTYLSQHPDIYMPSHKEPEYFIAPDGKVLNVNGARGWHTNTNRVNTLSDYQKLFIPAGKKTAVGEASANYLYMPGTAERIRARIPEPSIFVLLRNPTDRAFSAYLHHIRDGLEDLDFVSALKAEEQRIADSWSTLYHYRTKGYYYKQLCRFLETFGPSRVHVFLYEDLKNDPVGLSQRIFGILDIDDSFRPRIGTKHNPSGIPKNSFLQSVYRFLKGSNPSGFKRFGKTILPTGVRRKLKTNTMQTLEKINLEKPHLPPEVRQNLLEDYQQDILRLQDLIDRDLSPWLKNP